MHTTKKVSHRALSLRPGTAVAAAFAVVLSAASISKAQTPLTYKDSRGQSVVFPQGARSFADKVVSFTKGQEWTSDARAQNSQKVLGVPDISDDGYENYLAMGTQGTLVVQFTDNYLIDINGPDLWIFEIGPLVEAVDVAISKDGKTWINVGRVEGATAGIDIRSKVKAGDRFSFVRLKDVNNSGGDWPGADIDAIGAVGSIARQTTTTPAKPPAAKPTAGAKPTAAKPPVAKAGCKSMLRIEMKDGTVMMVDLNKVARIIPVEK